MSHDFNPMDCPSCPMRVCLCDPQGRPAVQGGITSSCLTDDQLRAVPVPVTGSLNVSIPDPMPVSGPITDAELRATPVPVSGTFWQGTQPVSASSLPLPAGAATEGTLSALNGKVTACDTGAISGSVSLGVSTGKTKVGQPGSLVTTATTADQVLKSYTVTAGKTLYLLAIMVNVRLTTFATTATNFGTVSLETPSGTKIFTMICAGPGVLNSPISLQLPEPLPIAAGTVIRLVVTPAAATSFTWQGNIIGYEK